MNNSRLIIVATILVLLGALGIAIRMELPVQPSPDTPSPLPWDENITTEEIRGGFDSINNEDILYATPKGIWRQSKCVEVTVPLPDPDSYPEGPISFPGIEKPDEVETYVNIGSHGVVTFNRCECGYRVEWECTRVSRFISAKAIYQGKKYVRYLYDRTSWPDERTLRRRLNALVVTCSSDQDCDFYCEGATPPYQEWGMHCRGDQPHRILNPPVSF